MQPISMLRGVLVTGRVLQSQGVHACILRPRARLTSLSSLAARAPPHGPNFRLTYKVEGKTLSESLPTPAAIRKAEREVAEFRKFQELSREFVETNTAICRLRPVEEEPATEQEKKRRKRSGGRSRAK